MKELTIEQKAQRYDEAIKKTRIAYKDEDRHLKATLESIFPELKESEDERIRKAIHIYLDWLDGRRDYQPKGDYTIKDMITWLNKQDEIDFEHYKDGENEKRKFVGYGFLKCKGDFLSFKEGETYWLEYIGKDNYNVRSDNLLGQTFHIKPVELYTVFCPTTWLEKQGNNKPAKSIAEAWKDMRLEVYQQASGNRHEPNYSDDTTKMFSLNDIDEIIEKMSEQKPANKVEPKFKVGDYVVGKYISGYISEVRDDCYLLDYQGFPIDKQDNYHLWSIEDAKDGDVLVDVYGNIGICEQCDDFDWVSYCSLGCNGGFQHFKIEHENEKTYPATKKQRDTLMKAMADAGYTFDFEKKELKKIEQKPVAITDEWIEDYWQHHKVINPYSYDKGEEIQFDHQGFVRFCKKYCGKPAWSEEDDAYKSFAISAVEDYYDKENPLQKDLVDWLKSLKDRVGCEANCTTTKEWSEEDKEYLRRAINATKDVYPMTADWLKSLKDRVQTLAKIEKGIK